MDSRRESDTIDNGLIEVGLVGPPANAPRNELVETGLAPPLARDFIEVDLAPPTSPSD